MNKIIGELPPGRYDGHVHIFPGKPDSEAYVARLAKAGFRGGILLSENPDPLDDSPAPDPEGAMDRAIEWASASETLYPFYWINPVLDNASDLVDMAVEKGMFGFKVLPGRFMPGDPKALPVYEKMAKAGKPVLFHSGILWDGRPSSKFTRPGNYEELIDIPGLRFCCAHISWPWCEECVALFGKLLAAHDELGDDMCTMFVDTTPGTPPGRRRAALDTLYTIGWPAEQMKDRIMFGTDCFVTDYSVARPHDIMDRDDAICRDLKVGADMVESAYRTAFEKFLFEPTDRACI